MYSTNHKGAVAEAAITAEAVRLGIGVSRPLADERYDLIFDMRPGLLRVQCKCAHLAGGVLRVNTGGSWYSPGRGYVRSTYTGDEIDAIAAHNADLGRSYLLPVSEVSGQRQVHLRIEETQNRQRAAINWAAEYEFPGAIAQLGERLTGSQEVGGSNPPSSIPIPPSTTELLAALTPPASPADGVLKETVGMDEFDARIAHYVRHAESGGHVLITRWGKPVARLGPADSALDLATDDAD